MSNKTYGLILILAALGVAFTAIADPRTSATIAVLFLLGLGSYNFYFREEVQIVNFISPEPNLSKLPAPLNQKQIKKRSQQLEKILELAKTAGEVGSGAAQVMLGVSNAAAESYLRELEKQGKLVQIVGTNGEMLYKLKQLTGSPGLSTKGRAKSLRV